MAAAARSRDRLSDLPDDVVGHILSFLPNKEAGRAAALSRRWRDIFGSVHAISFEEREGERACDWTTFYYESEERKSCSAVLLDDVCSALLCRRRCAGVHVPLRSFSFAFDSFHPWDGVHVDQWLAYVLRHSGQELHLDLRFRIGPICYIDDGRKIQEVDSASDDDGDRPFRPSTTYLPRKLFSCSALRTLCLSYCLLKLPAAVNLPSLETLRLTGIRHDSGRSVHRLISSCPRLADLTLEAVHRLKRVSVLDKRLRRFAIRCCHAVKNVAIDASELRCLDYTGTMPTESLLSLHVSPAISSCTIDFCQVQPNEAELVARFRKFLEKVSGAKHLHLQHRSLQIGFFAALPSFASLNRLVLQGPVQSGVTVDAVRMILAQTPNLEVLLLYMDVPRCKERHDDDDQSEAPDGFVVPDEPSFSVQCLRHRVREINMVHYQGDEPQRMMAESLLRNALVLERLCVVLAKGPFASLQPQLKEEIESWLVVADLETIFL